MTQLPTVTNHSMKQKPEGARTLIFSQRNLSQVLPYRCAHFEFEDVISQIDAVDVLAPRIDLSTRRYRFAKQLAYHSPVALNPGIDQAAIREGYDLFLAICGNPTDLLSINAIENWRKSCKKAVCLIDEVWVTQIGRYRNFLRMLDKFDLVVLYYSQSVKPVNELIRADKCIFLPPGVDTIRFCPYPNAPKRSIDVYSIGRRSAVTHRAFLEMAAAGLFYLHDSTSADQVLDPTEHRILFANISKRSRYFIVNPGLIDRPDVRGTQLEIGNRYFEAAASGNILLGERPHNGEFEKFFDWADAMIDLPYDSPDVARVIQGLDRDQERQEAMRNSNMRQALLRHDWAYRWEAILKASNISPMPQMEARKQRLQSLAGQIGNSKETPRQLLTRM